MRTVRLDLTHDQCVRLMDTANGANGNYHICLRYGASEYAVDAVPVEHINVLYGYRDENRGLRHAIDAMSESVEECGVALQSFQALERRCVKACSELREKKAELAEAKRELRKTKRKRKVVG